MSAEVLPTNDIAEPSAQVIDFPTQRTKPKAERKSQPDFAKMYTDLARLAFAAGNIEEAEQYRQMAEMFSIENTKN